VRPGIRLTKATAKLLIALFVFSCVSRAHPWRHHTYKNTSQVSNSRLGLSSAYELDADLRVDRVTLQSNGFDKTIRIKFGNLRNEEFGFTTRSDDGGNLVAGDIDRDGDVDLIWVGSSDRNNAVVLINQGEGNFAEVSDSSSYSSELDELFNSGDPEGKRSVKRLRKSFSLISSSFSDLGPGLEVWLHAPTIQKHTVATVERVVDGLAILTNIRKRGPPAILS
jgi:hypothetical protein